MEPQKPQSGGSRKTYRVAAALLWLIALVLVWEFLSAYPAWSNGLAEGLSYLAGAIVLAAAAFLMWFYRTTSPWLYVLGALALLIPGFWFLRWSIWLRQMAPAIGPVHPAVIVLFALVAVACFGAAAVLIHGAWQIGRRP